ncbi:LEAF RUST 10 DISEASE-RESISTANCEUS RECEPTOR-LIKE PROTEIN KINASE-like 2.2 [Malus domestica]|uniref:LEAF RUST 10 DISEASE-RESISTANCEUS RECEPTOR-LIKE PROTEIN KINASE-like 2.2 n=1 Tax=Malus domestica TaxID=3750 RepID=UPI003976A3C6
MKLDLSPDNGTTYVQQVLKQGFEVEYDLELCSSCKASDGTCESNSTSNDFLCFCGGLSYIGSYPQKCPGNYNALLVAIDIAIIAVCAILLWVLLCYIKNRIKNLIRNFIRKKNDRGLEAFIRENGPLLVKRYKCSEIRKMTKSFKDKLGQGSYGNEYKGYLPEGSPVAVKVLNASKGKGENFINEVASISRTSHVNVVTLLWYIAPEVVCRNFGGVSVKSDAYSYGMMVLEMAGGKQNVNARASHTSDVFFPDWIYKKLEAGTSLGLPNAVTEEENELARKLILVGLKCCKEALKPCKYHRSLS